MTEKQQHDRLRRMFRRIYRGRYSGSNAAADDFAFHMIDAKADFVAFARLLEAPDAMMPKERSIRADKRAQGATQEDYGSASVKVPRRTSRPLHG